MHGRVFEYTHIGDNQVWVQHGRSEPLSTYHSSALLTVTLTAPLPHPKISQIERPVASMCHSAACWCVWRRAKGNCVIQRVTPCSQSALPPVWASHHIRTHADKSLCCFFINKFISIDTHILLFHYNRMLASIKPSQQLYCLIKKIWANETIKTCVTAAV